MRTSLCAVALAAVLALGGCGSDDGDADSSSTSAGPAGTGDVAPDAAPAADPAAAVPLQPLDRALLPADFPADVAVADGTLTLADPTDSGWAVLVTTTYPAEQTAAVIAGAKDLLVEGGWVVTQEPAPGLVSWNLDKDGVTLVLSGYPEAGGAALNYNVGGGLS